MNKTVIRIRKIKSSGGLRKTQAHNKREMHNLSEKEINRIDESRSHLNQTFSKDEKSLLDNVNDLIEKLNPFVRRNCANPENNSVLAVELVLSSGPEFFKEISPNWKKGEISEKLDKWVAANKDYIEQKFGAENVLSFDLHLDEKTPHIHAVIIPLEQKLNKKKEMKWSLNAKRFFNGKAMMREVQKEYSEAMQGAGFDLKYIPNSGMKHKTVDQHTTEIQSNADEAKKTGLMAKMRDMYQSLTDKSNVVLTKKQLTGLIKEAAVLVSEFMEKYGILKTENKDLKERVGLLEPVAVLCSEKYPDVGLETASQLLNEDIKAFENEWNKLSKAEAEAHSKIDHADFYIEGEVQERTKKLSEMAKQMKAENNALKLEVSELRREHGYEQKGSEKGSLEL